MLSIFSRQLLKMFIVSSPTLTDVGPTNRLIYTSLTVLLVPITLLSRKADLAGIDDHLASKLTGALPPDVLRAFVELYCDILRELLYYRVTGSTNSRHD